MESKRFRILLLRGLLGGAVGGLMLVVALLFFQYGKFISNYGEWVLVGWLVFGLPYGAFVGSVVGLTTWLIHHKTAVNLGPFGRALIGTGTGMVLFELSSYLLNTPEYVTNGSWQRHFAGLFLFAVATGGVAGISVGRQVEVIGSATSNPPQ